MPFFFGPLLLIASLMVLAEGARADIQIIAIGLGCGISGVIILIKAFRQLIWRYWFDDFQIVIEKTFSAEGYAVSDLKEIWVDNLEERHVSKRGKVNVWCIHFEFKGSNFLSIAGDEHRLKELERNLNSLFFSKF